jgi:SUN family beta-glucosidase
VGPGATEPLTCPDGDTYFHWEGLFTSAQYYVNPQGVAASEACQWGNNTGDIGNWAPMNLGAGKTDLIYIALFPNHPSTDTLLDFNIRVEGDGVPVCKYEGGTYYDSEGVNSNGCTVSAHLLEAPDASLTAFK